MEKAASKGAIANSPASVGPVRQVALTGDASCEPVAPDAASSSSTSLGSTSPGSVPAVQGALDPTVRLAGFDERVIKGEDARYQEEVERLARVYGFDFVAIGLAPFLGAPLKWVYFSGATSARVTRIVLSPGHGIGGIVLKSGQPMMLTDIDNDLDPREYSSYPIVFAEDLRSFCALPLLREGHTAGVLLLAHRKAGSSFEADYRRCVKDIEGPFLDCVVKQQAFIDFEGIYASGLSEEAHPLRQAELSRLVVAQENERKRLSRELHDGIAQELLTVALRLRMAQERIDDKDARTLLDEALAGIDLIQSEVHNLSVELRPSTLDNFGLVSALRSQAVVLERAYGAHVSFEVPLEIGRFDPDVETQVYRICQEAMLNACKYSGADQVFVSISKSADWLNVTIADQGVGFNVEAPTIRGSGCGLSGMRERAKSIGGVLNVESSNQGTSVVLVAPMRVKEEESRN